MNWHPESCFTFLTILSKASASHGHYSSKQTRQGRGHRGFRPSPEISTPACAFVAGLRQRLFALKAEAFARFFGTPSFLVAQTVIVGVWIAANILGITKFDVYPFILLNLAFSLQAAYAAPLILLAQTRQADRDKALADADARHREDLALASAQRESRLAEQAAQLATLIRQNTELTELTHELSARIESLTRDLHERLTHS